MTARPSSAVEGLTKRRRTVAAWTLVSRAVRYARSLSACVVCLVIRGPGNAWRGPCLWSTLCEPSRALQGCLASTSSTCQHWHMTWTFYMRLDMREGSWLEGSETTWVVDDDRTLGHQVTIYAQTLGQQQETLPLARTRRAVLQGIGYATEAEAQEAAKFWRGSLMAAFASMRIGVDFGDRAARSTSWSRHAVAAFSKQSGRPAVNYQGGILVYESKSPPIFMPTVSAEAMVTGPARLPAALANARSRGGLSEERQVTYDLFSAALGLSAGDAQYAMLMAALETMIKPQPRSDESIDHVSKLMALTRQSGLPKDEVESLTGSLKWLCQESIGQAGRKIAATLETKMYMSKKPEAFFRECYEIRSRLLHGNDPLPSAQDVRSRIPYLIEFVADLICRA